MVLYKYLSLYGLSVSLSKNIFIFKCGCLSGSNNLNLHLKISFFLKSTACKNFEIFCPSVLTTAALYVTLRPVIFFSRCNSEKLIRILPFHKFTRVRNETSIKNAPLKTKFKNLLIWAVLLTWVFLMKEWKWSSFPKSKTVTKSNFYTKGEVSILSSSR